MSWISCWSLDFKERGSGTSLEFQWLRLHASNAGGADRIPGQGTRIPHAAQHGQKKERILTSEAHN